MSRAHPHSFPKDTPEPLAQPYSGACDLIDRVLRWAHIATGAAAVALIAWAALLFLQR